MSNVFGPVSREDWKDMSNFLSLAKFLYNKDPYEYEISIDTFIDSYNDIKSKYAISN